MSLFVLPAESLPPLPTVDTLPAWDILLHQAKEYAQPVISGFKVGALAVGDSGTGYLGGNIEFAHQALSQTLHAEQFALTLARSAGESCLRHLIVSELPCGHCRQFLQELAQPDLPITVIRHGGFQTYTLAQLLPYPFSWATTKHHLLSPQSHGYALPSTGPLAQAALIAANRSYAPYSNSPQGIALQLAPNKVIVGSVLESAAFNPTVSALQSALIHVIAAGYSFEAIHAAAAVFAGPHAPFPDFNARLLAYIAPQAQLMSYVAKGCG